MSHKISNQIKAKTKKKNFKEILNISSQVYLKFLGYFWFSICLKYRTTEDN